MLMKFQLTMKENIIKEELILGVCGIRKLQVVLETHKLAQFYVTTHQHSKL